MIEHLKKRFSELESQAREVLNTNATKHSEYGTYTRVDEHLMTAWRVKARHLLGTACGLNSEHYQQFVAAEEPSVMEENTNIMRRLCAIFGAAKEDFEGGYLTSARNLIHAEVFSTELDQARQLLAAGYRLPAAVVCGVVLETNLINLCGAHGLAPGKLDKMNADLAKAGAYNLLVQKQITALAQIRNSAAHGKSEEFNTEDVKSMIERVEALVASWLS